MSLLTKYKDTKTEKATIISLDKAKGRIGIYLRNGLSTVAAYLYDIKDLRVGMPVIVAKVNETYVILNEVEDSNLKKSYSTPKTSTILSSCEATLEDSAVIYIDETLWIYPSEIKPHTKYKWTVRGGGYLTDESNTKVLFHAPSYSTESTVTLSLGDGTICDSITIYVIPYICEAAIGYTTQQMQINEIQTLTVIGVIPTITYYWEIISGGGSLSSEIGNSVVYYSPSTNPNCTENPIIQLSANDSICDTLSIAINGYNDEDSSAYSTVTDVCEQNVPSDTYWSMCKSWDKTPSNHPYSFGYCCNTVYNCNGVPVSYHATGWQSIMWDHSSHPDWCEVVRTYTLNMCYGMEIGEEKFWTDTRTTAMKAAGCCPSILI